MDVDKPSWQDFASEPWNFAQILLVDASNIYGDKP
jgi:hypothetical protein